MVPNFLSNSDYENSIQHLNGKEAKKMFTCPEKKKKNNKKVWDIFQNQHVCNVWRILMYTLL